jgi:type IV pilus assembly protein PilO
MTALLARARTASAALKLALAWPFLIVISAGIYLFVVSPARARTAALEVRLAALQRDVTQARTAVKDLESSRLETIELEGRLESLKETLAAEREIPPLYRIVYDAAASTGLAVSLFQPREPRLQDYYTEIPISVTAEGTYHQLGQFFGRVARFPRVVTVDNLKMTGLERSQASLRAEMTLATYVYRPRGAPPPKPASARPASPPGATPRSADPLRPS